MLIEFFIFLLYIIFMTKQKNTPPENEDSQAWDKLLESPAGLDAFAELMKQAQKEVDEGKTEEN